MATQDTEAASQQPAKKKRSKLKMALTLIVLLVLVVAGLFIFGDRERYVAEIRFDAGQIGDDLDAYLADAESAVPNLREGNHKEIIWAFPASKAKTPLALVYLHGFSASKDEVRPVPDMAAEALNANLFFTRLTGHGQDGEAMATATAQDWLDDAAEAIEIGTRIGEKVVVIGTSTGGTLAAALAEQPTLSDKIAGFVFISPNFRVQAAGGDLLTYPYARHWIPALSGANRSFEPQNETHARVWTSSYPTVSILPMGALVKHALDLPYLTFQHSALFVFSDDDEIVDHTVTRQIVERWAGETQIHNVNGSDDPQNHVIAGDALSPSTNNEVADVITGWIKANIQP